MRLIIVSGLSGSGKSVALAMLEDLEYYCVDNIPAGLLPGFIAYTVRTSEPAYRLTAVGVDARNRPEDLDDVPQLVEGLRRLYDEDHDLLTQGIALFEALYRGQGPIAPSGPPRPPAPRRRSRARGH